MSESASLFCGCRYIRPGGETSDALSWWQVAACPDHEMNMGPLDKVPGD